MEGREEDLIVTALLERFPIPAADACVVRDRRINALVPAQRFAEIAAWVIRERGFDGLSAITGMDEGETIAVVYHLHRQNSIVLNLKVRLPRDHPAIDSVTRFFPAADLYERELVDLLGVEVRGLAAGRRYPLPEDWPRGDHPLRKDWKDPNAPQPPAPGPEEK